MIVLLLVFGIVLMVIAYKINNRISEKKFNRRNAYGVEEFDTYKDAVKNNVSEHFAHILANLLFLGGGILIIAFVLGLFA